MKRPRGTGSLMKLDGCRYWYAQFYDIHGKQRRVSTRTHVKAEAESVLRKLLGEKDRGVPFTKKLNYADIRAALLHDYSAKGNRSLEVLSDGTETIWGLKAVDTFFDGFPVSRITTDTARSFADKLLNEGNSNGTVNKSLALLRRMLSIAHEDGKLQNVPKIRLLKPGPSRKGFLPREKFDELLSHIPSNLKPLITLLYFCGVRVGEALKIAWDQVDLPGALIRLEEEQTKSGEPRVVPLPDVLVGMLALRDKVERTGTVFDGTNLRKYWQSACVKSGLGTLTKVEGKRDPRYHGLIIHDLRRSAVRNLRKAGVPEGVAMAISGHKTRSVFDRYNIVDTDDVVEAMRMVQSTVKTLPRRRSPKLLKP